jgi:hypothetical protein
MLKAQAILGGYKKVKIFLSKKEDKPIFFCYRDNGGISAEIPLT